MFAVAPSAGAWIEITAKSNFPLVITSLPPRERGLKSYDLWYEQGLLRSLPPRERGLK